MGELGYWEQRHAGTQSPLRARPVKRAVLAPPRRAHDVGPSRLLPHPVLIYRSEEPGTANEGWSGHDSEMISSAMIRTPDQRPIFKENCRRRGTFSNESPITPWGKEGPRTATPKADPRSAKLTDGPSQQQGGDGGREGSDGSEGGRGGRGGGGRDGWRGGMEGWRDMGRGGEGERGRARTRDQHRVQEGGPERARHAHSIARRACSRQREGMEGGRGGCSLAGLLLALGHSWNDASARVPVRVGHCSCTRRGEH
mmetsp:Transcript_70835/g.162303  ORF Transcript_70835/g.162303 Transcript_70835/m.162303 type:complete len:255 (-) Transcript_70835:110-874(-)